MRLMFRAALALAIFAFAAREARAQASFNIAAGATVPVGSSSDAFKTGYNVTVGVGMKPPLAPLGLRVEGMLNQLDVKNPGSASTRLLAGTANLTLSGAGMPIPMGYLIGGVGMYNASYSGFAIANPASSTQVGFNVGAGLNIPLTGFSTYLEARLHYVSKDKNATSAMKFVPITFGLKF